MAASDPVIQATGIVIDEFGDWRRARLGSLELRPPGPGQILIRCQAAALNFQDILMIEGRYQFKPRVPFIAGGDIAGVVSAVGAGAERFQVGQRVAGLVTCGAFADWAVASADRCFSIPDKLEFPQAAACTTVFATVAFALSIRGMLRAGEKVLITGAAGGVGLAAIQYARKLGAEVIALVSSEQKEKAATRAGAGTVLRLDRISQPKEGLRAAVSEHFPDGIDAVLDTIGGDVFDGAIRCLKAAGRMIVVGFASGNIPLAKANYVLIKGISVVGSPLEMAFHHHGPAMIEMMNGIYADVAAGLMDAFITETFSLEKFHDAAERITGRNTIGKIVLIPGQS